MGSLRLLILLLSIAVISCGRNAGGPSATGDSTDVLADSLPSTDAVKTNVREALLLTRYNSLAALEEVVQITYVKGRPWSLSAPGRKSEVRLTCRSGNREVVSVLKSGVSEDDFLLARKGSVLDRLKLGLRSPYAVVNRKNLERIENLGRRKPWFFGKGDVAFYDLAEIMVKNIVEQDTLLMSAEDLSEKGYQNTFNHITAQALMTSMFSERLADFVADVHERHNMPELITGIFTEAQLTDLKDGPTDNYLDLINNEWGQELGKQLSKKYSISRFTYWTPELMANYLNDIQAYYSWAFQIGFKPFRTSDEIVYRFAAKINKVKSQ
jgi:hypothetical protein